MSRSACAPLCPSVLTRCLDNLHPCLWRRTGYFWPGTPEFVARKLCLLIQNNQSHLMVFFLPNSFWTTSTALLRHKMKNWTDRKFQHIVALQKCTLTAFVPLIRVHILILMAATCFKQVGTRATKDWELSLGLSRSGTPLKLTEIVCKWLHPVFIYILHSIPTFF